MSEDVYRVREIDSMVKNLNERFDEHQHSDNENFKMINKRLSTVERLAWLAVGGIAALGLSGVSDLIETFI